MDREKSPLPRLQCPVCKTVLEVPTERRPDGSLRWKDYSTIECCGAWSVIAGIPFFEDRPRMARLIRAGKHRDALLLALRPEELLPRPSGLVPKLLHEAKALPWRIRHTRLLDTDASLREWLRICFPEASRSIADYFFYKATTPKHLVALSIAGTLPKGPSLDLGCGTGQITRALSRRSPVTGVDRSFWLLYLAKTRVAPDANFVCCDAERPLPFADGSFASVISSNAFHFIRDQEGLLSEFRRIADGPIALTSLRHTGKKNAVKNFATDFDGYRALADRCGMRAVLMDEDVIVQSYLRGGCPNLIEAGGVEPESDLITMILDPEPKTWGPSGGWLHTGNSVNPLYVKEGSHFHLRWPSEEFAADNPGMNYLPESVEVAIPHHLVTIDLPDNYG